MYMLSILDLELFHVQPPKDTEVRLVLTGYTIGKSRQFFECVNSILEEAISTIIFTIGSYEI